jgi:hypothetical protein
MEENEPLLKFLDDQLPTYINPLGVQLYLNTDSSIIICANYPGFEQLPDTSLELFQVVTSVDHLIDLLQLSRREQLVELTPGYLFNLYESGLMNIVCMLEPTDQEMSFRKNKKGILAKDTDGKTHQLTTPLHSPADLIAYTIQYYKNYSLEISRLLS